MYNFIEEIQKIEQAPLQEIAEKLDEMTCTVWAIQKNLTKKGEKTLIIENLKIISHMIDNVIYEIKTKTK